MRVSQFQKYSQKENTVTNNVLLMLSRLNDLSVDYYKTLIEQLNEGSKVQNYYPQPIFSQQRGTGNGIIDGHIEVMPSKILIETKLNQKELINKLVKYGQVFKEYSQNQLCHLSSKKFDENEENIINEELKRLYPKLNIQFNNLLFVDLIENLEGILEANIHDKELSLLTNDFKTYCYESDLVSNDDYKLLFVPTGFSFNWNKKHKMYFCPVHWHSQKFKFFGLYNWKSVRTISEIETIIIADFDIETKQLKVHSKGHTKEQLKRLEQGLTEFGESQSGLKYYIFPQDDFHETDFKKISSGGIQGHRYKDLRHFVDIEKHSKAEEVAAKLRDAIWK